MEEVVGEAVEEAVIYHHSRHNGRALIPGVTIYQPVCDLQGLKLLYLIIEKTQAVRLFFNTRSEPNLTIIALNVLVWCPSYGRHGSTYGLLWQ